MTYSQLWSYLVQNSSMSPRQTRSMKSSFPPWYNSNVQCEFRDGIAGHSVEEYNSFKEVVQELIDIKQLTFEEDGLHMAENSST